MSDFLDLVGNRESGSNPNIGYHNTARSSAAGQYGITDTTWGGLMRNYPQLGLSWANRLDKDANSRAAQALQTETSQALTNKGLPVNNQTLGLAWFGGPTAAAALIQADPNEAAVDVLARALGREKANQFLTSNPEILGGKTAGQVVALNQKSMGGGPAAPGPTLPADPGAPGAPSAASAPSPAQMPANFGLPTQGPSPAARVDNTGRTGDGLIATGMAIMGGNGWHDSMAKGAAAYQAASEEARKEATTNAGFQNDAINRDTEAPSKAAAVAAARAQAWNAMQAPTTLTAAQRAELQMSSDRLTMGDRHHAEEIAIARDRLKQGDDQFNTTARQTQSFIVPGAAPGQEQNVQVVQGRNGSTEIKNMTTGEVLPQMPQGAVPLSTYNAGQAQQGRDVIKREKDVGSMLGLANDGANRVSQIDQVLADANKPGVIAGPDLVSKAYRALAPAFGMSSTDTEVAKMSLGQLTNTLTSEALKGQGSISEGERTLINKYLPTVEANPQARNVVLGILRDAAARQAAVGQKWVALEPAVKEAILRTPSGLQEWKYRTQRELGDADDKKRASAAEGPMGPPAPPGGAATGSRPPLASFSRSAPVPATSDIPPPMPAM